MLTIYVMLREFGKTLKQTSHRIQIFSLQQGIVVPNCSPVIQITLTVSLVKTLSKYSHNRPRGINSKS